MTLISSTTRSLLASMVLLPLFACSITHKESEEDDDYDEDWVDGDDNNTWGSGSGSDSGGGTGSGSGTGDGGSDQDDDDNDGHLGGIDGGDDDWDGDVMTTAPGCDLSGAICYAFDGPLWAGQDIESVCGQLSAQYEAEGLPPMSYVAAGCPAGAVDQCSGVLMGADESGNPVDGSDVTIYNYQAASSSQLATNCAEMGGAYEEL